MDLAQTLDWPRHRSRFQNSGPDGSSENTRSSCNGKRREVTDLDNALGDESSLNISKLVEKMIGE
jgi:hypothetical protein